MTRHKESRQFPKSPEELHSELNEQVAELRARCAAYDNETLWEAKSIANSAYKLLYDGNRRERSLLGMLGMLHRENFISTARVYKEGRPVEIAPGRFKVTREAKFPAMALARCIEGKWTWAPRLERAEESIDLPFRKWWRENIFTNLAGAHLSRMNLVFFMRSQDGGAHVDDHVRSEAYHRFVHDAAPNIQYIEPSRGYQSPTGNPLPNAARATMRQIGWEIDKTLVRL
jgi:hypothetical protein